MDLILRTKIMDYIVNLITIYVTGFLELWLAVPLGFILKLPPSITAIISALGSVSSAVLVALAGDKLRNRYLRWRYGDYEKIKESRIYRVWNRYGVVGLGLLSPLFFGAPLGIALGIVMGADRNKLLSWMTIGIIIWSVGLTIAIFLGILTINL
jgi:hypothetical protein